SRSRSLIPKSSYYFGPPPPGSAYGTSPIGQIGLHHPREIIRIERDYTGGELIQFAPIYPLELEGRITPTQFLESINSINERLISAHSFRHAMIDNLLAVFTLQLSTVLFETHYDKEMQRLQQLFDELNADLYNPSGLNLLWPQKVAFLFLEIEYYVSTSYCVRPSITQDLSLSSKTKSILGYLSFSSHLDVFVAILSNLARCNTSVNVSRMICPFLRTKSSEGVSQRSGAEAA
ncbi:Golgin subfamily A member 7/ERF4 family-domain-containing protein, partial [Lentinula raphanica]